MILQSRKMTDEWNGRRTKRTFTGDEIGEMVKDCRERAVQNNGIAYTCMHAGTVPNCYDYPAYTTAVFVAAKPNGLATVIATTIRANKATLSGACSATIGDDYKPVFDNRYGDTKTAEARKMLFEKVDELLETQEYHWKDL